MGRTFEIERHPRRPEIDFALGNGAPLVAVAEWFGVDRKTVASYARRMLVEDSFYFDRLARLWLRRLARTPAIFEVAATFAEDNRRAALAQAEALFSFPPN